MCSWIKLFLELLGSYTPIERGLNWKILFFEFFSKITLLGVISCGKRCYFWQYNFSYNYGSYGFFVEILFVQTLFVRYFSYVTFRTFTFRTSRFVRNFSYNTLFYDTFRTNISYRYFSYESFVRTFRCLIIIKSVKYLYENPYESQLYEKLYCHQATKSSKEKYLYEIFVRKVPYEKFVRKIIVQNNCTNHSCTKSYSALFGRWSWFLFLRQCTLK